MLATQVILCVTVIGNIALFSIVLKERPSLVRTVFAVYVACIAGWALTIYINLFLKSLFVEDCIFATAAGMLTAQFFFAKVFPEGTLPRKLGAYWSVIVGCFFIAASFYPGALFTSIALHPGGYTTLDNGPLSTWYSLFALGYVCAPIFVCYRKFRNRKDTRVRNQLQYLTIGYALFLVVALLTNSVLPVFFHIYTFNAIGPSFSLLFASAVFYIIGKHEFLDIRAAMQRGVIYSFIIALIVAAYETTLIVVERYFAFDERLLALDSDIAEPATAVLVTIIGIFAAPYIERYFQKLTDRFFFKDRYDYALALQSLSEILHTSTDFGQLIERTQECLAHILRSESVAIILYAGTDARHDTRQECGPALTRHEILFEPITVDGNEIGGILVNEKRSGDSYSPEDAQLLRTFSLQAATAFARAQLFLQVQKHAFELEAKVAERTLQLRNAHESERRIMLDIAHGLQTPLTVFSAKLERLRSSDQSSVSIDTVGQSLSNLSEFIADLLKLARLEHTEEFHITDCPLSELVQDIAEEASIVAGVLRIEVSYDIQSNIRINADARELRSALLNLLSNSMKYMRAEDPRKIFIRLTQQGPDALLSIRDTGIGIPAADLPRIFERFYRAHYSFEVAGNGLGLAIAKSIIERHGGSISAESMPGQGTVMSIRLPSLPQNATVAQHATA